MTTLCECGCGQPTTVAKKTDRSRGSVKGQSQRFVRSHHLGIATKGTLRHGHTRGGKCSPTWRSYQAAKQRCSAPPTSCHYKNYSARGVQFLFASFEAFLAELGLRPEGKSLDRYPNNEGNYEPGNVRWATSDEQNKNKKDPGGWSHRRRAQ